MESALSMLTPHGALDEAWAAEQHLETVLNICVHTDTLCELVASLRPKLRVLGLPVDNGPESPLVALASAALETGTCDVTCVLTTALTGGSRTWQPAITAP